jgi:hypothetical protein
MEAKRKIKSKKEPTPDSERTLLKPRKKEWLVKGN